VTRRRLLLLDSAGGSICPRNVSLIACPASSDCAWDPLLAGPSADCKGASTTLETYGRLSMEVMRSTLSGALTIPSSIARLIPTALATLDMPGGATRTTRHLAAISYRAKASVSSRSAIRASTTTKSELICDDSLPCATLEADLLLAPIDCSCTSKGASCA